MRRAKRDAAKGADARRRKIHADYVRRHPEKARQERGFRKAQANLQKDWGHKVNGTVETHAKARDTKQGALARLFMSGAIDQHQLAWSQEIRSVAERIGADVAIGTASYETRVDQSRAYDGGFHERLGAVRAEVAYGEWRAQLTRFGQGGPAAVLAMIVEDVSCAEAARRYRMRPARARAMLIGALDDWGSAIAAACNEVDEAVLAAAQAGIL